MVNWVKSKLSNPLYNNAIYLFVNTAITSALGFVFWIIVARFYTTSEVGYSSAILSAAGFIASIGIVGFDYAMIKFLPNSNDRNSIVNSCISFVSILTIVLATFAVLLIGWWSPTLSFIKYNWIFACTFVVLTVALAIMSLIGSVFIVERRSKYVLIKNVIFSIIKIVLPVVLVLFLHVFGIISSVTAAVVIAMIVAMFVLLPRAWNGYRIAFNINKRLLINMWRYSIANYISSMIYSASALILPIIVINVLDPEQSAYFYIVWSIASILFALPTCISMPLFVEGSYDNSKIRENVIKSIRILSCTVIPAVIFIVICGQWILLAFGSNYSSNGIILLRLFASSAIPLSITSLYISILRIDSKIKTLIIICSISTIMTLVLSFCLIKIFGIIGIGYGWGITQILISAYSSAFIYKILVPNKK